MAEEIDVIWQAVETILICFIHCTMQNGKMVSLMKMYSDKLYQKTTQSMKSFYTTQCLYWKALYTIFRSRNAYTCTMSIIFKVYFHFNLKFSHFTFLQVSLIIQLVYQVSPVVCVLTRLYGFNWPRYMGGPMYYASQVGLKTVYDKICQFHKQFREY